MAADSSLYQQQDTDRGCDIFVQPMTTIGHSSPAGFHKCQISKGNSILEVINNYNNYEHPEEESEPEVNCV